MLGKLIGAYIGEKLMARSGRGGTGALAGAGSAAVARRSAKPLAMLLAAGYGLKLLNDYRKNQRASASS
ncbi:MAG: hypothetical protein ABR588_11925 [Sphingomicrobium sp.]|nr:hypothetical protein [Sphingomonadales bacterium]